MLIRAVLGDGRGSANCSSSCASLWTDSDNAPLWILSSCRGVRPSNESACMVSGVSMRVNAVVMRPCSAGVLCSGDCDCTLALRAQLVEAGLEISRSYTVPWSWEEGDHVCVCVVKPLGGRPHPFPFSSCHPTRFLAFTHTLISFSTACLPLCPNCG